MSEFIIYVLMLLAGINLSLSYMIRGVIIISVSLSLSVSLCRSAFHVKQFLPLQSPSCVYTTNISKHCICMICIYYSFFCSFSTLFGSIFTHSLYISGSIYVSGFSFFLQDSHTKIVTQMVVGFDIPKQIKYGPITQPA